ncbi:TPR-like protein [Flagelloscypha sp. PMI_526]|nr:TPR-like protein [Flagelloscypha sp. PMI_526]
MDAPTAFLGTVNKQKELVEEEEEYLDNIINSLGQEGIYALEQFQADGQVADLDTALEKLGQAVDLAPDGHPDKPMYLNNCGISHHTRFRRCGEVIDIDKAIKFMHQAVELTHDGHPDKPMSLNNHGMSHMRRFERIGEITDIDKAIESQRQAVDLSPDGHPNKPGYLNSLGMSHDTRFERLGEMADINKAIGLKRQAIDLTPDGHPKRPMYLNNLGMSHDTLFERLGEIAEIDRAIDLKRQAVDLTPDGHPDKPVYLNNLGSSQWTRFERLGEMTDIDRAIESQCQAIDLTPDGHPKRPMYLTNLGISHQTRFERRGEMADIDKAINLKRQAVELTPDGHPQKPGRFSNLGISHQTRFELRGEMVDIDRAIKLKHQAVDLTPDGHPDKPMYLNNHGNSHQMRFERLGEMTDIDRAIESQHQAVDLTPDGHPKRPMYLNNLGTSHIRRFERLGEVADIENAIDLKYQALELTPNDYPDKPMYLSNLGISHMRRFERLGELADIEKAIDLERQAVYLTANSHPDKPMCLSNLGISHMRRFERLGEVTDIDRAIKSQRQAVDLTPDGHPQKPMYLNNLGTSYMRRLEHLGEMTDVDRAIESQRQAADLTPDGHPKRPMYLNNLGISHQTRFERRGEMIDIDRAIALKCQAVDLTPDGHPDKPMYLTNLGISHHTRFKHLGEMADIDKAIELKRQLSNSLLMRFEDLGEMTDIDEAIKFQRHAVDLIPDDHPNKADYLNCLGSSHHTRFKRLGEVADIDKAISVFEQSAKSTTGPPIIRFKAARAWISALRLKEQNFTSHTPGLQPQHTLINLIPELVWLGAPVHQRFQTIQDVVGCSIHEAVSVAIRAHELELAVEWMEQGRSIVWSQLRQLRSPLVDLQDAHPDLAQAFQDVQRRIEIYFIRSDLDDKSESASDSLEQQAQAHRRNIRKREDLLTKIRSKSGFESFLRPEKFCVLSKACLGCLVVLLTIADEQCDALVILPSSSITHLSFTNMSQDVVSELHALWENSRMTRLSNRGHEFPALFNAPNNIPVQKEIFLEARLCDRGEVAASFDLGPMSSLLADLWERIVHPIVLETENDLFDLTDDRLPHITWCPSGPLSFLPFHAAGIYSSELDDRISISDYAVSSYTPSLMALLSNPYPVQKLGRPSILMVTQPYTPGQKPLPGTTVEAKNIMEKAALNDMQPAILHLPQSEATVSAVMKQLETHGWVHLACHGTQRFPDPMESSFALNDGALTLASLMQKSMGNAQFAFLSACQTATGDQTIPDEAMHLTSGMLAAGFRSVVGTMWSIQDRVAPEVAETFYATLFEEGRKSEWKLKPEPAYALHFALKKLRDESTEDKDLMKWVPFVHYGV